MSVRRCTFKCGDWNCGSYQFNLYKADIDQGDLCDVHYWQTKAQREWVGLTDEEICLAWLVITDPISLGDKFQTSEEIREFVRSIEAKLKQVNT